jgi:hypothetical protein
MPRLVPLALTAALLTGGAVVAVEQTTAHAAPNADAGRVIGQVKHPLAISVGTLAQYKQHTVNVTYLGGKPEVRQHHTFSGPLLIDVLNKANPTFNPARKNDALGWSILVSGGGNYRALIAWAEIMPEIGNQQILLAISEDGKPLDKPRTAVPNDKGGGRYVGDIATIKVYGP